jgi:putative aminopeptidase FrvX
MTNLHKHANPWGLKPHHCQALDMLIEASTDKEAARRLGVNPGTFGSRIKAARYCMDAPSRVAAVVLWDRYVHGRGVQA